MFPSVSYKFTALDEHYANSGRCDVCGYKQQYAVTFIINHRLTVLVVQSLLYEVPQLVHNTR
jgi:hypothetical protein